MSIFPNHLSVKTGVLLAVLIFFSPASKSENMIPDIGQFLKIGRNIKAQFGQRTGDIFFLGRSTGTVQLYRINDAGWPYQLTAFEDGIEWYKVSFDGTKAIVGVSSGGDEQTQIFLVDTETGQTRAITDRPDIKYASAFWQKDGEGIYYRSNAENLRDFKIYFYDFPTGKQTLLFDMDGSNAAGDISYDGKYMIVYHMSSNITNDLYLLNLESGRSQLLTLGKENIRYNYPSLSADNKTLYVICNDNPDGIMKLAEIDIRSGKTRFIDPDSKLTVEILCFSDNRRYMFWTSNRDGYSEINFYDIENDQSLPIPKLEGRIKDPQLLNNGKLIFTFDSPTRTSDIWQWDWKTKELRQITFATYAGIDRKLFRKPRLIKYKSFDGLEIPAFLYLPPNYKNELIPFIIRIHGGPAEQFRPYFVRNFQYFLLNGYGLLVPNIRGSLGYGKEYANLDNYKKRMDAIKDIKAGAEYLLENGYTEPGQLGIMGPSYGGFAVLATIIEYPNLFSAAIDRTGISNFVTYLKNTKSYRTHLRETEYGPLSDSAFLESISPLGKAHLIKTPLLIAHGENDTRVPISETRQIIRAIKENDGIVDSLIFPDEGHIISKQTNRITLYRKVVEFLDRYLKNK